MNDYEPGTVAVATVRGVPNVLVMRVALSATHREQFAWVHDGDFPFDAIRGATRSDDSEVADVRPLVVLDPEDREQIERLRASLERMSFSPWACGAATCLRLALREQTKPAEPTGLGAVVEDGNGKRWTRYDAQGDPQPWWCDGAGPDIPVERRFAYADIDAVRVLSDGVQP